MWDKTIDTAWCRDGYYYYPQQWEYSLQWDGPTTVSIEAIVEKATDKGKEVLQVQKQDFLDALGDVGIAIGAEEREVIRDATDKKWRLFVARLLARAFELEDLAALKEKPKEVYIKK